MFFDSEPECGPCVDVEIEDDGYDPTKPEFIIPASEEEVARLNEELRRRQRAALEGYVARHTAPEDEKVVRHYQVLVQEWSEDSDMDSETEVPSPAEETAPVAAAVCFTPVRRRSPSMDDEETLSPPATAARSRSRSRSRSARGRRSLEDTEPTKTWARNLSPLRWVKANGPCAVRCFVEAAFVPAHSLMMGQA